MYALLAVGDMGSRFGVFGTLDRGEVFQVLPERSHCGLVRHELGSGSPVVQQRADGVNPGTRSHQGVTHIVAELQQLFLREREDEGPGAEISGAAFVARATQRAFQHDETTSIVPDARQTLKLSVGQESQSVAAGGTQQRCAALSGFYDFLPTRARQI